MTALNAQYLEAKVRTAPAHRLQLMLIEGAIRFGRQAEELLRAGEPVAAATPLMRVVDIVGELLAGVRQQKSEINSRLGEFYWFLFRRISEAKISSDADKLAESLRLLEYERETWRMVCEKIAESPPDASPPARQAKPPHSPLARFDSTSLPAATHPAERSHSKRKSPAV